MALIVGIDFGTSTTVVRYKIDAEDSIYSVKDSDGVHDTIPSAIFRMSEQNQSLYGNEALNAKNAGMDGELITNFKMGLLEASAEEQQKKKALIEEFLKFIYERFKQTTQGLQYDRMDVYVSYPAKWSDGFIKFMKDAVRKAGFSGNIHGINEPKAATYNMLHRHLPDLNKKQQLRPGSPMNVFMLDMGAGTTDIAIFRLNVDTQGTIEIDNLLSYPSIDNPCLCGGREIDDILSRHVLSYISNKTGISMENIENIFTTDAAKLWKDTILSPHLGNDEVIKIPLNVQNALMFIPGGREVIQSFNLSKNTFENITEEHWEKLYSLIVSAIEKYQQEYGVGAEDIDMLFLTGGHSQWYTVKNLFYGEGVCGYIGRDYNNGQALVNALNFEKLKNEPWRMFSDALPHECVAIGLCLQDQKIRRQDVAANNVWIRLEINNKISDPILVVRESEILPTRASMYINLGLIESDWDSEKENDFRGYFYIYSGSRFETALCQKTFIELNVDLITFILLGHTYFVTSSSEVKMSEEGLLDISGYVRIKKDNMFSSPDYIRFTTNDFKTEQ